MTDHDPPAVAGTVRRTIDHDGVVLSVLDTGEIFLVVLATASELAYSWRHSSER